VHPDGTFSGLLHDPGAALRHFFPELTTSSGALGAQRVPPQLVEIGVTSQDWANHNFGCRAIVYEMCAVAMGRSLLELIKGDPIYASSF
jgi:hypothetical protein